MYPPELVAPMKSELTEVGFEELLTPDAVDKAITSEGTTFVLINSVCGCAAANARPAARMAVTNDKRPDRITTKKAAAGSQRKRFKNGKLVHFIERHHIEGRPAEMIAENLAAAFNEYC